MNNIHNQLDYNLTSLEERLAYLQNNIPLSRLTTEELELCTNYVLYAADLKYKPEDNLELLEELDYNLAQVESSLIQKKNLPVDWAASDLSNLAATYQSLTLKIEHLKSANMPPLDKAKLLKFYQKWRSSVVADAHLYPSQEAIGYYTSTDKFYDTTNSAAEEVYRIINFSDPYHLRSILLEWHNLHSSPDMEPLLDFFNLIYWSTPMKPWERHLLERWKDKVDGLKNLDIQQDLWLTTGRLINHHNYLNQAVVRLCQRMTDTYYALQAEKHFAGQSAYWKYCPVCGRWKIDLAPFWKKQEYGEGETNTKKQEMCESCRLAEKIEVGKKLTAKNLNDTQLSNLEKRIAEFELMQQWTLYKSGLVESWTAKKRQLSNLNAMPKNKPLKNTFGYTIEQATDAADNVANFYLLSLMNQLETEGVANLKHEYKQLNGKIKTGTTETIASLMGRYVANNYNFSSSFDSTTEIEEEYIPLLKFLTRHYAEKMGDYLVLKYKTMPFFGIPEIKVKAKRRS